MASPEMAPFKFMVQGPLMDSFTFTLKIETQDRWFYCCLKEVSEGHTFWLIYDKMMRGQRGGHLWQAVRAPLGTKCAQQVLAGMPVFASRTDLLSLVPEVQHSWDVYNQRTKTWQEMDGFQFTTQILIL
jgi:hypothetical protein